MWTPRRILLLLLGVTGFAAVYVGYSAVLGSLDGLPQLPPEYAVPSIDQPPPPPMEVLPTVLQLEKAFGANSQEVQDTLAYKTKIALRDKGIVIASGQPFPDGTPYVTVSPFSIAFFGKPRPAHLLQPGEVEEISTFHADKAILQFDRRINTIQDLTGTKATLVGMELLSAPEIPSFDPRRGQIEVTNNQRTRDPRQHLVFRTVGPLFYKSAEAAAQSPNAPQVWTSAAVEVVDRKNLPRPLGSASVATSAVRGDELRNKAAIADILLGTTLPPPTITAEGMKLYLESQDPKAKDGKRNATGYTGVKRVDLDRKVQMNLWTDGGGGFPGSAPPDEPAAAALKAVALDPPLGAGGVAGGFADAVAVARRFEDKTLLVIETPGSFRYDFDAGRARFESAPVASEAAANHVTVFRASALGRQDDLSCRELVVDFADPPGQQPAKAQAARPTEGMKIKSLTATGPYVYVSVESEQLLAQGTELHYTTDPKARTSVTTLRGNPVNAVQNRNHLIAGAPKVPAEVVITSTDPDPKVKGSVKQTALRVAGPGIIKLYDQQSNDTTLLASWGKSLTQEKELVGKVEQDLLKFEGGGAFEDLKGDMKLTGDQLWLWLAPDEKKTAADAKPAAKGSMSNALPQRLLAVGRVESQSAELVIGIPGLPPVDKLTVWFRDVPPPPDPALAFVGPPPPPAAPQPQAPPAAVAKDQPPGPKDPPKEVPKEEPKKPVHLSARVIESWVVRYPVAGPPAKPDKAAKPGEKADPDQGGLKYEMERARCEDRVVAHQDPTDPAKNPRGLDIKGDKLNVDQSKAGSVLEVFGPVDGQVHFEGMSIWGPAIKIDQPANTLAVKGRGVLVMPSQSDTGGGTPEKPTKLRVFWGREMLFEGAKARAEFVETVVAEQLPDDTRRLPPEAAPAPRSPQAVSYRQPAADPTAAPKPDDGSWGRSEVRCHEMKVTFDRPVYFNNYKRSGPKPAAPGKAAESDSPKLKTAQCTPMPQDELDRIPPKNVETARRVYYLEETFDKAGKRVRAQRIITRQLDVSNDEEKKEQTIRAYGGGEVRLLQPGSNDEFGKPARPKPPPQPGKAAAPEEQSLKLTWVKFTSRMFARDTNKLYQEATFDDGARMWHVPTDKLELDFPPHRTPPGTIMLACTETMKVSSSKVKPDAQADQRLTAIGNAEFEDDEHQGYAHKITYAGDAVILDGTQDRDARLFGRAGVAQRENYNAQQITYYKDGTIRAPRSRSGTIIPP